MINTHTYKTDDVNRCGLVVHCTTSTTTPGSPASAFLLLGTRPGHLTEGVKGWQHVEVHTLIQHRLGRQREAQHAGILPLGDLELHFELLLLLTCLQLGSDFRDDVCPPVSLLSELAEAAEEHH